MAWTAAYDLDYDCSHYNRWRNYSCYSWDCASSVVAGCLFAVGDSFVGEEENRTGTVTATATVSKTEENTTAIDAEEEIGTGTGTAAGRYHAYRAAVVIFSVVVEAVKYARADDRRNLDGDGEEVGTVRKCVGAGQSRP